MRSSFDVDTNLMDKNTQIVTYIELVSFLTEVTIWGKAHPNAGKKVVAQQNRTRYENRLTCRYVDNVYIFSPR